MNPNGEVLDLSRHSLDELEGKTIEINNVPYTILEFVGGGGEAAVHRLRGQRTGLSLFVLKIYLFLKGSPEYQEILTTRSLASFLMDAAASASEGGFVVSPHEVYEQNGGLVALQTSLAGGTDPEYYAEDVTEGVKLIEAGQDQSAIKVFDRILARNPNHVHALVDKAICLGRTGSVLESLSLLTRCIEVEPNYTATYHRAAECNVALGRPNTALECLTATLDRYAVDCQTWRMLVKISTEFDLTGDVEGHIDAGLNLAKGTEMAERFRREVEASQHRAQRYSELMNEAMGAQIKKQWTKALQSLDLAIAVSKGNTLAKLNRALCLYRTGQTNDVAKEGGEIWFSLAVAPRLADTVLMLLALTATGMHKAAIRLALYLDNTVENPVDLPRIPIAVTGEGVMEEASVAEIVACLSELLPHSSGDDLLRMGRLIGKYKDLDRITLAASG